MDLAVNKWRN